LLTSSEQDGHDRQVHRVDQASAEILLDGGRATGDLHVPSIGGIERPLEGGVDAIADKVERGPTLHRDRRMRLMGEHEGTWSCR
jgi:hypothetical protein